MKPAYFFLSIALASTASATGMQPADIQNSETWQERRLFHPTPSEQKRDKDGGVMIYEGMRDLDIKLAMNANFDRIESMMFVRTKITDKAGEVVKDPITGNAVVEEDGC